ncbi:MAG: 4Fe-4S dicluster domain-containing protein [Planctomycetota bacterium]|jgi:formate hydrogenlyase subunit 6/NADH:ubiquinone oxidoreductase subunit I
MKCYFIDNAGLTPFVQGLIEKTSVIAPMAKGKSFVFDRLVAAEELRLDYSTTILPPKKVFFPAKQDLLTFEGGKATSCLNPQEAVLFGVHPYDIKAISMTDKLFAENYSDSNYLANREKTVIVGSSIQNAHTRAFFSSIAQDMEVTGHDAFLTKIADGYVLETLTDKGDALAAGLSEASADQAKAAVDANNAANGTAPQELPFATDAVAEKVRGAFESDVWTTLSEDCFSCGSCNIVCPTCYCHDVQDEWGLGADDGKRYRRWDACLTSEFSEVSVQGGSENFRENRAERYRHRFMRKTAYLNERLGAPACVGCGRCATACTADIADPVKTITTIMEG